jgi:putative transposase
MRKENITIGSYVHVFNRGNKQSPIYRQKSDLWRMLFALYYLNTKKLDTRWPTELERKKINPESFVWPRDWGEKNPIVSVLGFTIMPNHFHLILKETSENGISNFMHKFSMGHSKFINAKYNESGRLFEGKFKSKILDTDEYLCRATVYVMIKNLFELYPRGGLEGAKKNFEDAWQWGIEYPFSSLAHYAGKRESPILDKDSIAEVFDLPGDFKQFSNDYILGRATDDEDEVFE